MDQISSILNNFAFVIGVILSFWWIYTPVLLYVVLRDSLETYNTAKYLSSLKWVLLQVKIPRDVHRSPKAMEQVFAALHSVQVKVKKRERYFKGKVSDWFSFEIVGRNGSVNFFIRMLEAHRNLVESQVYAHFPEAELIQTPDYMTDLPGVVPDNQYDIAGGELALTKEDAYPIKTYFEFEESGGAKEDIKRIDPLASLTESFGAIQSGEFIALQVLFRATGDDWIKKGQAAIDKLMGKEAKLGKPDLLSRSILGIDALIPGGGAGEEKKEEKKKDEKKFSDLNPGAQEAIKAIERSFGKLAFETGIRFVYIAPRDRFNKGRVGGVTGAFKQFSTQNLNGFKMGFGPGGKWPFKEQKEYRSKVWLYDLFRQRTFPLKPFVLTTEELATIYHFPDVGVEAPTLERIEAKKGEPPFGLPVV